MSSAFRVVSVAAAALTGVLPVSLPKSETATSGVASPSHGAAVSAPVDGATCRSVGRIQTTSVGTFRCAKSGNRTLWKRLNSPPKSSSAASSKGRAQGVGSGSRCSNVGEKKALPSGYLECRNLADGAQTWVALTRTPPIPRMPVGGENLDTCRLREARVKTYQPWNVGFPRGDVYGTPMLPTAGRANVQLIAVDFPDARGTEAELAAAQREIEEVDAWFEFFSKATLSLNWQFPKQWLRMSKPAGGYALRKGDRASVLPMAQEIVSLADPYVDFTSSDFVFVLFPRSIKLGETDLGMANWRVESVEGPVRNLFGGAEFFYDNQFDLWSFWVHEYGHPMGLSGHSPRSRLSVMDDQNGNSVVLNVWDAFHAGWLGSDEVYCMPIAAKSLEISLIPLERRQHGPRGVIVPLSDTNALVIESHRAEGWGSRMLDPTYGPSAGEVAAYGVSVYYVDTTMDTDRYAQSSGYVDSDRGDRWADHVVPKGASRAFDLLLQGDKVAYRGIAVEFVKTGDLDLVRITKQP